MAWTDPPEWVDDEVVTAALMNTNIRANLLALKSAPSDYYPLDEVSDYSTASTTFVAVDGVNLSLAITTTGGDVLIGFTGCFSHDTATAYLHLEVDIDAGTTLGGDDGVAGHRFIATTEWVTVSFTQPAFGLDAGVHTFVLHWKTSAGTVSLSGGAGTANRDVHGIFWVKEW